MNTCQEFVSDMSESEIRELESRLRVIIEHLLKIKHVKGGVGIENLRGWRKSVRDQQNNLADLIDENPALKPKVTDVLLNTVYRSVVGALEKIIRACGFPESVN